MHLIVEQIPGGTKIHLIMENVVSEDLAGGVKAFHWVAPEMGIAGPLPRSCFIIGLFFYSRRKC